MIVGESARQEFKTDGVTFLPGALPPDSVRMAEEAFAWSVEHPGPTASPRVESTSDAPAVFGFSDLCNPDAPGHPLYVRLLRESPLGQIVADLWGEDEVWFMYEQVFLKEGRRKPQDAVASGRPLPLCRRRPPGGHLDHLRPGAGRGLARICQGVPSADAVQHLRLRPRRRDHSDLGGIAEAARHRG